MKGFMLAGIAAAFALPVSAQTLHGAS